MVETGLVKAIHRHLPKDYYTHSNTLSSQTTTGIPDRYYDGEGCYDLWVEYKMLDAMPRDGIVGRVDNKKRGCYRTRQYEWMERRWNNSYDLPHGPNVIGVIGLPNRKAVIQTTPTEWREGSSIASAISFKEVAAWIRDFCSPSSAPSVRR